MRSEHEDRFSTDTDQLAVAATPTIKAAGDTVVTTTGKPAVVEEVLIEEVSIDGMCGVY